MTAYEQGFLAKCAELGVDGGKLLEKQARLKVRDAIRLVDILARKGGNLPIKQNVLRAIREASHMGKPFTRKIRRNLIHSYQLDNAWRGLNDATSVTLGHMPRFSDAIGIARKGTDAPATVSAAKNLLKTIGYIQ